MPQAKENSNPAPSGLVYVVSRYGQIVDVFASFDDALQAMNLSIQKGHLAKCEPFLIKPDSKKAFQS